MEFEALDRQVTRLAVAVDRSRVLHGRIVSGFVSVIREGVDEFDERRRLVVFLIETREQEALTLGKYAGGSS